MEEIKGIVVNGTTYGLEDETTNETATTALNLAENNANDITALENSTTVNSTKITMLQENVNNLDTKIETVEQTANTALAKAEEFTPPKSKIITCTVNSNKVATITENQINELLNFDIKIANTGNHSIVLICNKDESNPFSSLFDLYNYQNSLRMDNIDNNNFYQIGAYRNQITIKTNLENISEIKVIVINFFNTNT